ncbi:MAG TPA: phosphotransferase [Bacillota bacterium]|nr:phosphotransferase [Bacillota bacterium]
MEQLLAAVNRAYGLNADQIKPLHSVWRITSPKGLFILKKMNCSPERLYWLQQQLSQLAAAGFHSLVPVLPTGNDEPFIVFQNQLFIVTPWQSGNNPLFNNLNHLKKAAEFWGKLHSVAQHLTPSSDEPVRNHLADFKTKSRFLENLLTKLNSQKEPNRIDRAILKWGEYYLKQASLSMDYLQGQGYERWLQTAQRGFCHNDPAPRNIIIQNKNWFLIDFELSGTNLFLDEYALLIGRVLRANQWNPALVAPLSEVYVEQRSAAWDELRFLPGLLCFPRSFWRFCCQRFTEGLEWTEKHYQSRLWEITQQEEPQRLKFLQHWFGELTGK